MTYRELYERATTKLEKSKVTLGEYEEMTKALDREIGTCKDCKYAEIHNGKLSEHCSVKCEPFCRKFLRFVSGEDFYCADFEKRGTENG